MIVEMSKSYNFLSTWNIVGGGGEGEDLYGDAPARVPLMTKNLPGLLTSL